MPLDTYDHWINLGGHADMHYLERHRQLRLHPANLFPGTRTVISLLLSYKSDTLLNSSPLIAQYAYGEDYHHRLRLLLHTLSAQLKQHYPDLQSRPCVDSAPIPEKYWAVQAGLGWIGRNTLLVNPTFGSFVNLAELLVTLPADHYDTPLPFGCPPDCHACITACPNHALNQNENNRASQSSFSLNSSRCTAYNTIENPSPQLPSTLNTAGYAFGCDICQLACPYNKTAPARRHLSPQRQQELLALTTAGETEFNQLTRHSPLSRITYNQWLRNLAKINTENNS